MSALDKKITALDTAVAKPTDLIGALNLLFADATFDSAGKIQDPVNIAKLKKDDLDSCDNDLKTYDHTYYGEGIGPISGGASDFVFAVAAIPVLFGAVEALYNSFVSIVTPVATQLAVDVDRTKKVNAIEAILKDPKTVDAIKTTGGQLAQAIDDYATASRRLKVGAFVEQLVQIRTMAIDVSKTSQCRANLDKEERLQSGAPGADFINCWQAAWGQLAKPVANLVTIGDDYDALADNSSAKATKTFGDILAKYEAYLKAPKPANEDAQELLQDLAQLISLGNAIANAASKSNATTLETDLTNVFKALNSAGK